VIVERAFLRRLPRSLQRRQIRHLFRRNDPLRRAVNGRVVEEVLQAAMRPGPWERTWNRARVFMTEEEVCFDSPGKERAHPTRGLFPATLPVPSSVFWAGTGQTIAVQQAAREHRDDRRSGKTRILVDADRLSTPLIVRAWQPGDRFQPAGMKGRSKKLQDFFTDSKVPLAARRRVPVVVAPEGIVWIVGYRQDARWEATTATKNRLQLTVTEAATGEGAP